MKTWQGMTLDEFMDELKREHPDWLADTDHHMLDITKAIIEGGPESVKKQLLAAVELEIVRERGEVQ
jgi:hypothetical protein